MKKLKLDGRSAEERLLEELKLEEEKKDFIELTIQADSEGGVNTRPEVKIVIQNKKSYAPK